VSHPLSPGGHTFVVLDACVLLPSRLSDVLFDLMLEGLFFAHWTASVEGEFLRNWALVHTSATDAGPKRLNAFRRAAKFEHLIYGDEQEEFLAQVPSRVHANDRHLVSAALVLAKGSDEEEDASTNRVFIVTNNLRHLAVSETRHLGVEVVSAGAFLDLIFKADPKRTCESIEKSLRELKSPPYSKASLLSALHLHGAPGLTAGLAKQWNL
jgi:hypothetical protein